MMGRVLRDLDTTAFAIESGFVIIVIKLESLRYTVHNVQLLPKTLAMPYVINDKNSSNVITDRIFIANPLLCYIRLHHYLVTCATYHYRE